VDPYARLEVTKDADAATIKRAYRRKAARAHPDRRQGNGVEMADINLAYQILGDERARARYDSGGAVPEPEKSLEMLASHLLVTIFTQLIDKIDPEQDLIATIRQALEHNNSGAAAKKSEMEKEISRTKKRLKKLRYKQKATVANFFEKILNDRIEGAQRTIEEAVKHMQICSKAQDLLCDFSYEAASAVPQVSGWLQFSQVNSPTRWP
jgi:curved DNA-binding protein CbpA